MLVSIGRTPPPPSDALGLLVGCHERIRTYLELASALAQAPDDEHTKIAGAASQLVRYFTVAFPLHRDDEDLSLTPRLLAVSPPSEVVEALHRMTAEHDIFDPLVDRIAEAGFELTSSPLTISAWRAPLTDAARQLSLTMLPHLAMEESILFPAAQRLLPPTELASLLGEMRARRHKAGVIPHAPMVASPR